MLGEEVDMLIKQKDWMDAIGEEFEQPYFKKLEEFVEAEYKNHQVFPPKDEIFNALEWTPLNKVKVLLVGQDPYYNEHQAHGLAFSVLPNQPIPKSLVNIYKELSEDLGIDIPNHGYLKKWADQGVLMINTVLTVRAKEPNSHRNQGWEQFTDQVIKKVNGLQGPLVIFLWGKPAQKKIKLLDNPKHLVLQAPHPSPLSAYRGFFGCKCFSACNDFLIAHGSEAIDWQIDAID